MLSLRIQAAASSFSPLFSSVLRWRFSVRRTSMRRTSSVISTLISWAEPRGNGRTILEIRPCLLEDRLFSYIKWWYTMCVQQPWRSRGGSVCGTSMLYDCAYRSAKAGSPPSATHPWTPFALPWPWHHAASATRWTSPETAATSPPNQTTSYPGTWMANPPECRRRRRESGKRHEPPVQNGDGALQIRILPCSPQHEGFERGCVPLHCLRSMLLPRRRENGRSGIPAKAVRCRTTRRDSVSFFVFVCDGPVVPLTFFDFKATSKVATYGLSRTQELRSNRAVRHGSMKRAKLPGETRDVYTLCL